VAEPTNTVTALAPDGTPIEIPASEAATLNRGQEGRVLSDAEAARVRHDIDLQKKYEGVEGYVAPPLIGAARGLSFGLSDLMLSEVPGMQKRLADYEEYAPQATTTGEVAGMVGGALLGAGAPGVASKLGRAAEGAIARGIGEESAMSRVASRVLGGAASGAVENGLYEAGKTASDSVISDEPLTAEKLVAGAKHGVLLGGGVGAVLGGASSLWRESRPATQALEDIGADADAAVNGGVRPSLEGASPKGTIGDYIAKTADVKTIKALGGSAGDLRALEGSVQGGFRRVAQDIRSDVEATTGKSFGLHSRESLNEYAAQRVEQLGDKLGTMLERLDEGATGIAPKPGRLIDQARNDIIKPNLIEKADGSFVTLPGQEKVVNAVEGWLGRIEDAFSDRAPTFKEWQRIRVGLDKEINYAAAKVSPKAAALRQLRSAIEDELVASGESAASSMGSSFQADYQATKSLYQSVKKAAELTERGVSRDLANNSLGLTSRMAGIAGASVGGIAGGLAAGLAGKVVQSHGDQLAADLLSRAASMSGVQRIVGQVGRELDTGVSKLIGKTLPKATAGIPVTEAATETRSKATPRESFARTSDVIAKASANPAATVNRIERSLGSLSEHAPRTADAVVQTTIRGVDFLASKLPPSRHDPYSLQPQFQTKSRASDTEISQFMRYTQAVDDPLIVLREAKSGTLTRDHVEAVQAVYPKLYDEIRGAVFRSLVESKSEIPYQRRIQLGILLDIPTDKTLSPDFREAIQATYSSADQAGAESPPTTSAAPEIAGSFQTATERATERAQ
jgi:hypothetical protein